MRQRQIRVLVVEDSPVALAVLLHLFESDPQLAVVATAHNGVEAVATAARVKPDVVTMDIQLPGVNGYDATRAIMSSTPVPIVVVSSHVDPHDLTTTFRALEAGALMAVRKPVGPEQPDYDVLARELITAVKLMSEVKVVRRTGRLTPPALVSALAAPALAVPALAPAERPGRVAARGNIRAVGIGASTGGPVVLRQILSALPANFPAPIFIVQHMAEGFIHGLAEWLDQSCPLKVAVARQFEPALPGHVYLAPDRQQFQIDEAERIFLLARQSDGGFCPSVNHLFQSLAAIYGAAAAGILLTGMGEDGAAGLQSMRQQGALTIAQDEASSVIFGMPKAAIELGAAGRILNPHEIPRVLLQAVQ